MKQSLDSMPFVQFCASLSVRFGRAMFHTAAILLSHPAWSPVDYRLFSIFCETKGKKKIRK